jgi:ATP-binding cassette subfamily F protein uup
MTCEKISKSYSLVKLLDGVDYSIDSADKIGLIGVNGTGKSTFLKILVGIETPDTGQIMTMKNLKINYLEQEQDFSGDHTVLEQIFGSRSETMTIIRRYEHAMQALSNTPHDSTLQREFDTLSSLMASKQLFDLEFQVKSILNSLGIENFDAKIGTLSGGQKKRVALAEALVTPCDLLVLDEPTNHLDSKTILWLETYLKQRSGALIMITHDRYFLDRIVNKTIELSLGKLYEYMGNYEYFIEKKSERMALEASMSQKQKNMYKRELAWMRAGVQARSTKSKSRIQRFQILKSEMKNDTDLALTIEVGFSRLGGKIIEIKDLGMSFGNKVLFEHFEYFFAQNDRIGIVGDNGVGKSTLLNLVSGNLKQTSGTIDIGSTVKLAYFTQDFDDFTDIDQRAIEYIREIAEYVTTPSGYKISASELMETFLFTTDLQWTPIQKLSGGERRRLQLLGLLIGAPNVLILDEPTNNLDLDTLKVFEQYLDQFQGVILCVSHDRYFLDRICDKLFAFENGVIKLVTTSYSDYLEQLSFSEKETNKGDSNQNNSNPLNNNGGSLKGNDESSRTERVKVRKEKLTFKEIKALEDLPKEIDALSEALDALEHQFAQNSSDFEKLTALAAKKEHLETELLEKMEQYEALLDKESALSALSEGSEFL